MQTFSKQKNFNQYLFDFLRGGGQKKLEAGWDCPQAGGNEPRYWMDFFSEPSLVLLRDWVRGAWGGWVEISPK